MGLLSQEYLNALLFPSPGNLSDLGIKTASPTLKVVSLNHQGSLSIVCLYNTKNILFIIFFEILASLGLQYGAWAFSSCDAWVFLVAEHRCTLQRERSVVVAHGLSSCAAQALECTGSLVVVHRFSCPVACKILIPQSGIEPMCPALEDRFLTTRPSGKSQYSKF